jgi:5-methylcytosine-specific restriction endonuclease McrA
MATKEYYAAHRDELRAKCHQYYKTHKEQIKARSHEYHLENKEHRNAMSHEYHEAHREAIREQCKKYRVTHKNELRIYKRKKAIATKMPLIEAHGGRCVICGYNKNIKALEFHHVNPAEKETAKVKTFEEAAKCVLLCNRCHREHHFGGILYEGAFA